MPDSLRLAFGTLCALPVPAPRRLDVRTARSAMLLAPLVGALLGVVAAAVSTAVVLAARHQGASIALLASVLAITTLALLTRALHLDGLVDTVDGLGVKPDGDRERTRLRRLEVMRRPDAGPFGVAALIVVILVQVTALAVCVGASRSAGAGALVLATTSGRLGLTWACSRGVPCARPDGLGAAVAGSVPVAAALVVTLVVGALSVAVDVARGVDALWLAVAPIAASLLATAVVVRLAWRRLGGITGDVLGAVVEVSTAAALVVAALVS